MTDTNTEMREKVARIIDPAAFLFTPDELGVKDYHHPTRLALERADAILALFSRQPAAAGEGKDWRTCSRAEYEAMPDLTAQPTVPALDEGEREAFKATQPRAAGGGGYWEAWIMVPGKHVAAEVYGDDRDQCVARCNAILRGLASPPPSDREERMRVLLDNLVIAQSLSKEIRQKATDEARSYLYSLRHPRAALTPGGRA